MVNESLRINLGILEEYSTPAMPRAILFLLFFLIGILIAFLFSLSARFKARRTIKKLNTTLASHNSEMAGLRSEIDSLKGIETPEATGEMDATQQLTGGSNADSTAAQTGTFSIDKKDDESADKQKETAEEKK